MQQYSASSMVIDSPKFVKVADYELPKDYSQWQNEILKQFFEKFQTLPQQFSVDMVITNVDENRGYAKGSVVVGNHSKQLNFPVIVRDFMLSPFDTFCTTNDRGEPLFMPATKDRVDTELVQTSYGVPSTGPYSSYDESVSLKRPGGIPAKVPVVSEDISKFSSAPSWRDNVRTEDMKWFQEKLAAHPDLPSYFQANTGSLINDVINLGTEKGSVPKNRATGTLDIGDVVKAKQAVTFIDSLVFDPNKLIGLEEGSAGEIRRKVFPTMEQFIESGDNSVLRQLSGDMGQPVSGLVIALDSDDRWSGNRSMFVSAKGGAYYIGSNKPNQENVVRNSSYLDDDHVIYGSDLSSEPKVVDGIVNMLKQVKQIWAMTRQQYDKGFVSNNQYGYSAQPWNGGISDSSDKPDLNAGVVILYKEAGKWKGYKPSGSLFREAIVNGSPVYIDNVNGCAIVAAPVSRPVRVQAVDSPEYRAIISQGARSIILMPQDAVILNLAFMRKIERDEVLRPSDDIRRHLANLGLESTTVAMDEKVAGFVITGPSAQPLYTILGMDKTASHSPAEAKSILTIVGCDESTIKDVLYKVASGSGDISEAVTVYGTRSDYVDTTKYNQMQKCSGLVDTFDALAKHLKNRDVDLIKAASMIADPEAVDSILSLNFINRDNLLSYVEALPKMQSVVETLSAMLVASRMGLQQVDESALKTSIDGLEQVISGLVDIKTSLGE